MFINTNNNTCKTPNVAPVTLHLMRPCNGFYLLRKDIH